MFASVGGRGPSFRYYHASSKTNVNLLIGRSLPTDTWSMIEEKCGIIFASMPAIRQFVAYYRRVGTFLPSSQRQTPGGDFVKMRARITLRDIIWYRRSDTSSIEPRTRLVPDNARLPSSNALAADPEKSRLDIEEAKIKHWLGLSEPHSITSGSSRTKVSCQEEL